MWRNTDLHWAFMLLTFCFASCLKADEPATYVSKGACPFECCAYGNWPVVQDVEVHEHPSATAPVLGSLTAGGTVEVTTGELRVIPGRARVIDELPESAAGLDPDSEIEILDYLGEGYSRIRQAGKTTEVKIARTKNKCAERPNWRYCWVEVIQEPVTDWWVQLGSNSEFANGWIRMEGGLSPIDECG